MTAVQREPIVRETPRHDFQRGIGGFCKTCGQSELSSTHGGPVPEHVPGATARTAPPIVDLDQQGARLDQAKAELFKALDDNARLADELERTRARIRDLETAAAEQKPGNKVSGGGDTARVTHLLDQVEAQQRELERLGRDHADVLQRNLDLESARDVHRAELDQIVVERDQLRTKLAAALKAGRPRLATHKKQESGEHRHAYPQATPDELPGDCECGKPWPRALFDADEDDEAGHTLTGWDLLFEELRDDVAALGWPDDAPIVDAPAPVSISGPRPETVSDNNRQPASIDAEPAPQLEQGRRGQPHDDGGEEHGLTGAPIAMVPAVAAPPVEREAKRSTRRPARCGTTSGYSRHRYLGEDACQPCKDASAKAARERYAAKTAAKAGGG